MKENLIYSEMFKNYTDRIHNLRDLSRYRYLILSIFVLVLMVFHTVNGQWGGDFWIHSAVIRELATHPIFPQHPQVLLDAPHTFYSPYALGVAWISRLTNLTPIATLSIVGIINLILFLIWFRLFIFLLFDGKNSENISFYSLLFMLILWGRNPWTWSGFLHLWTLGYVLPYPSTFAAALMFLSFSIYIQILKGKSQLSFFALFIAIVLVLLTHPPTAVVMCICLIMLSISLGGIRRWRNYALLMGVFFLSFLFAAAWPCYPFWQNVILSQPSTFLEHSYTFYSGAFTRIFPVIIGLPLLMLRIRLNWRDPLALMFFGLCLIYFYGAISRNWSYGRVIFYIVLMLDIVIAVWFVRIESELTLGNSVSLLAYRGMIILILICVIRVLPVLIRCFLGGQNDYGTYLFLSKYTKQYDVILSDIETSALIPVFGGKVVAAPPTLYGVNDAEERIEDLERFFKDNAYYNTQLNIIRKYKVGFLLLNIKRSQILRTKIDLFKRFGNVVYSDNNFVLIKVSYF
ncbi:MAG: hypothetical protein V1674_02540 [Candidatus Omnitrophota bacterium]